MAQNPAAFPFHVRFVSVPSQTQTNQFPPSGALILTTCCRNKHG